MKSNDETYVINKTAEKTHTADVYLKDDTMTDKRSIQGLTLSW